MERIIIFKNSEMEISISDQHLTSAKGIQVQVSAVNPFDGLTYTKNAGWISCTGCLHAFSRTPYYIEDKAAELIGENIEAITKAIAELLPGRTFSPEKAGTSIDKAATLPLVHQGQFDIKLSKTKLGWS